MSKFEGKKAPAFKLLDQNGETHELSDYKGQVVVVYFYPKDSTPGCTLEAQQFRNNMKKFKSMGVQILGISKDSVESHYRFADKQNLNFPILSDESRKVVEKYDVLIEKSMFGKSYMGVSRQSFLIDKTGKVVKHYENVKPKEHFEEILKDIRDLELA